MAELRAAQSKVHVGLAHLEAEKKRNDLLEHFLPRDVFSLGLRSAFAGPGDIDGVDEDFDEKDAMSSIVETHRAATLVQSISKGVEQELSQFYSQHAAGGSFKQDSNDSESGDEVISLEATMYTWEIYETLQEANMYLRAFVSAAHTASGGSGLGSGGSTSYARFLRSLKAPADEVYSSAFEICRCLGDEGSLVKERISTPLMMLEMPLQRLGK